MKHLPFVFLAPVLLCTGMMNLGCSRNSVEADAYGNFESVEVIVSAQSQGELLSLEVQEGAVINKGQRVGSIDSTSAIIKRKQILAQQEVARAKMENLESQIHVQEQQRKNLVREANRLDKLQKENAVPMQQVDDVVGQLQVLDAQIATLKTQRNMIRGEMQVIAGQLDEVLYLLSKYRIINPIEGTVLEKYAEPGELLVPGKSLYKIANLSVLELKLYISGAQLSEIAVGDTVQVRVDKGYKDFFYMPGTVSWISSEVEFTPKIIQTKEERVNMVYAAKVRVVNQGLAKIGMPGEVIFSKP